MSLKKYLAILGKRAEDKVTGLKGVTSSISFDLYGYVQILLTPGLDEKGELRSSTWFDINRIKIEEDESVMEAPNIQSIENIFFHSKGPADKPAP